MQFPGLDVLQKLYLLKDSKFSSIPEYFHQNNVLSSAKEFFSVLCIFLGYKN